MRDRIAASAREKLSQVDKEKQIQAERKRRAAMFINMLKSNDTDSATGVTNDVSIGMYKSRDILSSAASEAGDIGNRSPFDH